MHAPFFDWHKIKSDLHFRKSEEIPYFYEREVWWCSLGANIGWEQDGKGKHFVRPVVVLKIFTKELLWAIPLTTKEREGRYYYAYDYRGEKYTAILSQMRLISSRRLIKKAGVMPQNDFVVMKERFKSLIV